MMSIGNKWAPSPIYARDLVIACRLIVIVNENISKIEA